MHLTEQSFLKDIENHTMTVKMDNGVYRHLTFSHNGSSVYRFDIVTYPGFLVYSGDMGCYVFQRLTDMFEFFRSDNRKEYLASQGLTLGVNHGYWAQKLQAMPARENMGTEFCDDEFTKQVKKHTLQWCRDYVDVTTKEDRRALWNAVEEEVIYGADDRKDAAYHFTHKIDGSRRQFDLHEFVCDSDFTVYTHQFQWCCYALAWGIQQYDNRS